MKEMEKKIQGLVKEAFALIKEESVLEFMKMDENYMESSRVREELEKMYIDLEDTMGQEESKVIEAYIEAIERNHTDTCDLYYLAGITDAIRFLSSYGMLQFELNESLDK